MESNFFASVRAEGTDYTMKRVPENVNSKNQNNTPCALYITF